LFLLFLFQLLKMLALKYIALFVMAAAPSSGVIFDCDFKMVNFRVVGKLYTCGTEKASGKYLWLTNVKGTHTDGRSNRDIQGLIVKHDYPFNQLPTKISKYFPKLVAMQFMDGNITSISAEDLKSFPQLKLLGVYSHKLTTIDGDLFKYTPHLQLIDFDENVITNVGQNLLSGLTELKRVYFKKNTCINGDADNPDKIKTLKKDLIQQCPPTIYDELKTKLDEQKAKLDEQKTKLDDQERRLKAANFDTKENYATLEAKLDDANANLKDNYAKVQTKFDEQGRKLVALEAANFDTNGNYAKLEVKLVDVNANHKDKYDQVQTKLDEQGRRLVLLEGQLRDVLDSNARILKTLQERS